MAEDTSAQTPDTGAEVADDQAAQQSLANAAAQQDAKGQEGAEQESAETPETDWKAEAEKWKAQSRKHEKSAKDNSDAAKRLKEIEDGQKSEAQRLNDQLAERDLELQTLKLDKVRREAADKAGLPPELVDTITAVDPDEALEQAQRIASYVTSGRNAAPAAPPAADLHQGARTQAPQKQSPDDWIRSASRR